MIPESQLGTWSHQGAITISSAAYTSINAALTKSSSPLVNKKPEIYLQGSYANSTNIYGDSDIDVVVLYENTFYKDMTALTLAQQQLHEMTFSPASYHWRQLRDDVLAALRDHFGNGAVTPGKKSIKVQIGAGRKSADVVPAVQFRRYVTFVDRYNLTAYWGIQFFDSAGNAIVNYPKYHIANGEAKNHESRTRGRYKATVRVFKNLRNYMVDNKMLSEGIAPSYYMECLMYNVPDNLFVGRFENTIPTIINYLLTIPFNSLMSQNGVTPLIGTGLTQWSENNFVTFIFAAKSVWDNWV